MAEKRGKDWGLKQVMKIARIGTMRQAYPPLEYGGTQRSIVQMTIFQAAICAHDVTLYGPAESTIIDYSAEIAKKLGLDTVVNQKGDNIRIKNNDGRIGNITLRTTGHNATGYRNPDERKFNKQLFGLLIEDEIKSPYDIIHNHYEHETAVTLIPTGLGHKTLTHSHGNKLNCYSKYRFPIICISNNQAHFLKKKYDANVYDVIHHGLDPFTFKLTSDNAGYLTWIGRFLQYKGTGEAIKIAKRVNKPLVIAGTTNNYDKSSKKYFTDEIAPNIDVTDFLFIDRIKRMSVQKIRQEIKQLANQTGITAPIIFVGAVNDTQKQTLFGNAMGTLYPIKWSEPFGRVMIESMACGTPVIGYTKVGSVSCGAVEEVVEDGVTGFQIKGKNDKECINKAAGAVLRLNELNRMHVRKVFERDWSSERVARQIDAAYKRCMAEPIKILPGKSYQNNKWKRLLTFLNQ